MTDRIKQFIDESYVKGQAPKRRTTIELDQFLNIAIVTATIGKHTEIRHYLDGHEIYIPWLIPEERRLWAARMRAEGFTGRRIAAFLSVSPATVYNDLRYLRVNHPTRLLNLAPTTRLVAMSDMRIKRDRLSGVVH